MDAIKAFNGEGIDVCLRSALEGKMGTVWTDHLVKPELCLVSTCDFYYILGQYNGKVSEPSLQEHLREAKGKIIKVSDPDWSHALERLYPETFRRFNRYATKTDPSGFKKEVLESHISALEEPFSIKSIDEEIYEKVITDPFMADCCCFSDRKKIFWFMAGDM